jgi:hypothetical protein
MFGSRQLKRWAKPMNSKEVVKALIYWFAITFSIDHKPRGISGWGCLFNVFI